MPVSSTVKLNIGGEAFKTSRTTLSHFNGLFKTMLEKDTATTELSFPHRSPKHFDLILNYMRDGDVLLPRNNKELAEVREEAEFYQLNELARQCDSIWIVQYNKGPREMLRRIAGSKKDILVVWYSTHKDELINCPEDFSFPYFYEQYSDKIDVYFQKVETSNRIENVPCDSCWCPGRKCDDKCHNVEAPSWRFWLYSANRGFHTFDEFSRFKQLFEMRIMKWKDDSHF
ncbi:BTB domain-containing protein [Caenorhabditis elegans]|uniref:BTB domain-containing protein n=1 Tax=Caenorhabditis elegans TaxID=6239 RepID=Q9TZB0_CAEEL|nr:BTB domain-containing protein [Caenorhabditis elegans]CCD66465.1 BTB domain-containing protein [Caenorhabditis elegans]|eukprot:NP_494195.3 Uncharacterized protein CELE_C40A11.4 [Caenorhabditis elegans]